MKLILHHHQVSPYKEQSTPAHDVVRTESRSFSESLVSRGSYNSLERSKADEVSAHRRYPPSTDLHRMRSQ